MRACVCACAPQEGPTSATNYFTATRQFSSAATEAPSYVIMPLTIPTITRQQGPTLHHITRLNAWSGALQSKRLT